jgi:hypothetical protein
MANRGQTMDIANRVARLWLLLVLATGLSGCDPAGAPTEPSAARAPTTAVTVTATVPDSSARDTTIEIQVIGTGFDRGSAVTFLRDGVPEPKMRVNSTKYVKATALTANVTIAGDAPPDAYDVMVTTSTGKKGIGTEKFTVLLVNVVPGTTALLTANGQGQAAGVGCDTKHCRPLAWIDGRSTFLPLPAGSCGGRATAMNALGVIAGRTACTVFAPLRWTPSAGGGYTMQTLERPAGSSNYFINDINGQGIIAGSSYDPALNRFSAVLWDAAGAVRQLASPLPDVGTSEAQGINESGLVAGYVPRPGGYQPVVWLPDGSAVQLRIPDTASYGFAKVINDRGVVSGNVGVPSGYRAVRWLPDPTQPNAWLPAEYLVTAGNGTVNGINNADQIVGVLDGLPFFWEEGRGAVRLPVVSNRWGGDAYGISEPTAGFPRIFGRSIPPSNASNNPGVGVWWPVP